MNQFSSFLKKLLLVIAFFCVSKNVIQAQCVQIESILVAACGTPEGQNEMFRFRVGPTAVNTSTMTVNWPSNAWGGVIQNTTTSAKVATLNADILAAGGCASLLQPTGGILPANAPVIVVTSYLFDTAANSFGALTEDTYILFQNSTSTGGHFGNYQPTGTRTLSMSFGSGCNESVTYTRNLLSQLPGAAVSYTASGTASYFNNGCSAPVAPFTVDAGPVSMTTCAGAVLNFVGTAQGQQSVQWNATQGTFSNPTALTTSFTIPATAVGTIAVTLTATNSCGATITDTITLLVNASTTPTFTLNDNLCNGEAAPLLPNTSNNGISGSWSPDTVSNTLSGSYIFTPNANQCAVPYTLNVTVGSGTIVPTFDAVAPICAGETLAALPTTSNNGISGTWSPALNNTTTTYTFTPAANQCATNATLIITVNPIVTPTFAVVNPICEGETLAPLPNTSQNGISGTWSPALNNTTTTTYTFTPDAGQCATTTTLTVVVNNGGTVTPITGNNSVCIGDTLALANATTGGTWSSTNSDVATVDINGLVTPLTPGFTRIIYTTTSACTLVFIDITVYLPPNPLLTDKYICVDKVTGNYLTTVNMQCGVENANHTFEWTLNGQVLPTTSNLHVATQEGLYQVNVTNNTTGCSATAQANVIKSSTAIAEATVREDFEKNQIITVTVTGGSGDYEYQLDNNWPQASNQFVVQQGVYTITVIDKNGCGSEELTVFALNYPRYFTPNNDGYHDTWFIEGLSQQQEAQIFIFDRYGKLVKAITPYLSQSWDGTLNGYPLPSTDYWFTLNYINKDGFLKDFKSHFSLKR